MEVKKTMRQVYKERTGKDAEMSASDEECGLAVYIEAPTRDYVRWLERRASEQVEPNAASTNRHITSALYVFQEFLRDKGFSVDPECVALLRERLNAEIGTS